MQRTLTASFALTTFVLSITACSSDSDSDSDSNGGTNTAPTGSVISPASAGTTTPFTTVQNDDTPVLTIGGSTPAAGSQASAEPTNSTPVGPGMAPMPTSPGTASTPTDPGTMPTQATPGTTPTALEPGADTPPSGPDTLPIENGTVDETLSNGVTVEELESFWACLTTDGSEEFVIGFAFTDDKAGLIADETVEFAIRWDVTTNDSVVFSFTDNPSVMGTIETPTFQSNDAFQSSGWTLDGDSIGRLACQRTAL